MSGAGGFLVCAAMGRALKQGILIFVSSSYPAGFAGAGLGVSWVGLGGGGQTD